MDINVVKPAVAEIDILDPRKRIEMAGRVCYSSFDKMTETSHKEFVSSLIKREHYTPLEHAAVAIPVATLKNKSYLTIGVPTNPYPRAAVFVREMDNVNYLCGTIRALVEHHVPMSFISQEETIIFPGFRTFCFTTDRAIANQLVRHRAIAYQDNNLYTPVDELPMVQSSLRYIDGLKKPLDLCAPLPADWATDKNSPEYEVWYNTCTAAMEAYLKLREYEVSPQFARKVLPLSTATTVVMSGYSDQWDAFLRLRLADGVDPGMLWLTSQLWTKFYKPTYTAGLSQYSRDSFDRLSARYTNKEVI